MLKGGQPGSLSLRDGFGTAAAWLYQGFKVKEGVPSMTSPGR